MSYRTDNFDLNSMQAEYSRPLRPFNWVQWTGVAFAVLGGLAILAYFGGKLGWIPQWIDEPTPGPFLAMMAGSLLINSRREPLPEADELQRQRNRKVLLVTVAILAAIFGAVLVIEFTGA